MRITRPTTARVSQHEDGAGHRGDRDQRARRRRGRGGRRRCRGRDVERPSSRPGSTAGEVQQAAGGDEQQDRRRATKRAPRWCSSASGSAGWSGAPPPQHGDAGADEGQREDELDHAEHGPDPVVDRPAERAGHVDVDAEADEGAGGEEAEAPRVGVVALHGHRRRAGDPLADRRGRRRPSASSFGTWSCGGSRCVRERGRSWRQPLRPSPWRSWLQPQWLTTVSPAPRATRATTTTTNERSITDCPDFTVRTARRPPRPPYVPAPRAGRRGQPTGGPT